MTGKSGGCDNSIERLKRGRCLTPSGGAVGEKRRQRGKEALRERVKELSCLYGIARLVAQEDVSFDETLQGIAELLPPAWRNPERSSARISLDGRCYETPGFGVALEVLKAEVVLRGEKRGVVEVGYSGDCGEGDNVFLEEEKSLIEAVAGEVAFFVERREAERDRAKLHEQLRHADRLATLGILAAGVAHELNEPLGNILGYAQLAKKCPGLPEQAGKDIDRIETASLRAREIIKNMLLFSRQKAPIRRKTNLNDIVSEGMFFFEARCERSGVELTRELEEGLPDVVADADQLNQALVNLVVNALQAMPSGGRLTLRTKSADSTVSLSVEDTGCGMSEEVVEKLFIPFFTTKDIGQGTGLGLPVAHGIVAAHGGWIRVDSEVGKGSAFEIRLPVSREDTEEKK